MCKVLVIGLSVMDTDSNVQSGMHACRDRYTAKISIILVLMTFLSYLFVFELIYCRKKKVMHVIRTRKAEKCKDTDPLYS